jgi:3D (Asp-Asp-Asp) domain-containing protein
MPHYIYQGNSIKGNAVKGLKEQLRETEEDVYELVFLSLLLVLILTASAVGAVYYSIGMQDKLDRVTRTAENAEKERDLYRQHYEGSAKVLSLIFDEPWDANRVSYKDVFVSAYTSTPEETDSAPWTTANNEHVVPGGAAFSRDIPIPFGKRVILAGEGMQGIVYKNDVMNKRLSDSVDIWCPEKQAAKAFGRQNATAIWLGE